MDNAYRLLDGLKRAEGQGQFPRLRPRLARSTTLMSGGSCVTPSSIWLKETTCRHRRRPGGGRAPAEGLGQTTWVGSAVAPGQRLNHLRKGQVELRVAADMVSENEVEVGVDGVGPW